MLTGLLRLSPVLFDSVVIVDDVSSKSSSERTLPESTELGSSGSRWKTMFCGSDLMTSAGPIPSDGQWNVSRKLWTRWCGSNISTLSTVQGSGLDCRISRTTLGMRMSFSSRRFSAGIGGIDGLLTTSWA